MALAKAKRTIKRLSGPRYVGVTAGVTCYQGGLAILASGYARPGRQGQGADNAAKAVDAATYRAVGIFLETVTGGVANGDVSVNVEEGPFLFKNSAAGDALTAADIGKRCYIIDDETVAKTNPNSTRAVAGVVTHVGSDGIMVDVTLANTAALSA
ncbi:MAG TPA: hypothetical protein VF463_10575 [Sphingobium sp.]